MRKTYGKILEKQLENLVNVMTDNSIDEVVLDKIYELHKPLLLESEKYWGTLYFHATLNEKSVNSFNFFKEFIEENSYFISSDDVEFIFDSYHRDIFLEEIIKFFENKDFKFFKEISEFHYNDLKERIAKKVYNNEGIHEYKEKMNFFYRLFKNFDNEIKITPLVILEEIKNNCVSNDFFDLYNYVKDDELITNTDDDLIYKNFNEEDIIKIKNQIISSISYIEKNNKLYNEEPINFLKNNNIENDINDYYINKIIKYQLSIIQKTEKISETDNKIEYDDFFIKLNNDYKRIVEVFKIDNPLDIFYLKNKYLTERVQTYNQLLLSTMDIKDKKILYEKYILENMIDEISLNKINTDKKQNIRKI